VMYLEERLARVERIVAEICAGDRVEELHERLMDFIDNTERDIIGMSFQIEKLEKKEENDG